MRRAWVFENFAVGGEIAGHPRAHRGQDASLPLEEGGRGVHDGGSRREEGVGDQFEGGERGGGLAAGAGNRYPAELRLRQAELFREAVQHEGEHIVLAEEGHPPLARLERKIVEDFVGDDREAALAAELRHGRELVGVDIGARGIVRIDEDDGLGALAVGSVQEFFQRGEVDRPAAGMAVFEPIPRRAHRFQRSEMIEERVAGPRHQNGVAGVAEQLEEVRVSLRGRGAKEHAFGVGKPAGGREAVRDRFPRRGEPLGVGRVEAIPFGRETGRQRFRFPRETRARRV